MTNTEALAPITEIRWVSTSAGRNSSYSPVNELLRIDAPAEKVAELVGQLIKIRGVHLVEVKARRGEWDGTTFAPSGWFGLYVRGTDAAVAHARLRLAESGLRNEDRNADHDHAACIAHAASLGVPASYAHTPETYLSQ